MESVNAGSKGVAFKREITLNPADKAEADTFDTITVCGPSYGCKGIRFRDNFYVL